MADIWEPETEDGYTTDEWLETIKTISDMPDPRAAARRFLLETLPEATKGISCCSCEIGTVDGFLGRKEHEITFITGGWSGAEDLIETALSVFWIGHFYYMWKRGGLHVFRVPIEKESSHETK